MKKEFTKLIRKGLLLVAFLPLMVLALTEYVVYNDKLALKGALGVWARAWARTKFNFLKGEDYAV